MSIVRSRIPGAPLTDADSFDAYYFANCCGQPYRRSDEWLAFFGGIADRIVADLHPGRVLDVGCAFGFLVEALRDRGVEAFGLDVSSFAIAQVAPAVRAYCREGSIADELEGRYDLVLAIEVLEHVPAELTERAIANICRHTDDVLFSSAPSDFAEPTHVNVRPPEDWAERFARNGLFHDVDFDASFVTPWAARFRRASDPPHRLVRRYERQFWQLRLERNEIRNRAIALQDTVRHTAEALEAKTQEIATLHRALRTVQDQLRQAWDTIAHMERSVFWRARSLVERFRGRRSRR